MYERKVMAGEILIKEGDTGAAASELFVVKSGEFEVAHCIYLPWDCKYGSVSETIANL